jgi:hypothetical protein
MVWRGLLIRGKLASAFSLPLLPLKTRQIGKPGFSSQSNPLKTSATAFPLSDL